jgi:hypothetical protein
MTKKIHEFFGLTYASYLVLPRVFLESMPDDWQARFVEMIEEIPEVLDIDPEYSSNYTVHLRDEKGRFKRDLYSQYRRRSVPRRT